MVALETSRDHSVLVITWTTASCSSVSRFPLILLTGPGRGARRVPRALPRPVRVAPVPARR